MTEIETVHINVWKAQEVQKQHGQWLLQYNAVRHHFQKEASMMIDLNEESETIINHKMPLLF